ncbi:hypothetical protein GCK72_001744 [Caenorhabditis remanei]|uniref:Uncharacterized protein n=1 Tax=Caenorhabditis remanei TaxID=31234 RepID=E3LN14_CAERE|nr:hypothetical protein GCK72_001744 [Caenorhabditis remanei]EFP03228.1 hypothetical protein CRE_28556 [Caenorhabditis remanei]KAF1769927.1 hypothetical protein GCK72_001744 [Caenorhabditis remanei]
MNFVSVFLIALLAIGVLATELETKQTMDGGAGIETHTKVDSGDHQMNTQTELHNRQRRWGYYGGYGGYGMGYGRPWGMGYGMRGYGMGYGMGYPMWG